MPIGFRAFQLVNIQIHSLCINSCLCLIISFLLITAPIELPAHWIEPSHRPHPRARNCRPSTFPRLRGGRSLALQGPFEFVMFFALARFRFQWKSRTAREQQLVCMQAKTNNKKEERRQKWRALALSSLLSPAPANEREIVPKLALNGLCYQRRKFHFDYIIRPAYYCSRCRWLVHWERGHRLAPPRKS